MSESELIEELRGLVKRWKIEAVEADRLRDTVSEVRHNHWIWNEEAITLRRSATQLSALLDKHADTPAAEACSGEKDKEEGK